MIYMEDLIIEGPFSYLAIQHLHIHQVMSDHGWAELELLLEDDEGAMSINRLDSKSILTVKAGREILFTGHLFKTTLRTVNQVYVLTLKLVSASYQLDIKNKKRSFQDVNQTYPDLFQTITQEYGTGSCYVKEKMKKGAALIQYEETDWEFIKRIASLINTVVYSDISFAEPKLHLGVHTSRLYQLEQNDYTVAFDYQDFLYKQAAGLPCDQYSEIVYRVETTENYQLGDKVIYQGVTLTVLKKETNLKGAMVKHLYDLKAEEGISTVTHFSSQMRGTSILGTVLEVKKDQVKVHLVIDEKQDQQKAAWYTFESPYTGEGHTGWYCMPREGDQVLLYLDGVDERNAVVRKVSRTDGNNQRIQDPSRKYLGTVHGNEMAFTPVAITFSEVAESMYLKLNQQSGVELTSNKDIVLNTNTVGMECKNLEIVSNDKIIMATNRASVITDRVIQMKGM